jgi:Transporter associated domain
MASRTRSAPVRNAQCRSRRDIAAASLAGEQQRQPILPAWAGRFLRLHQHIASTRSARTRPGKTMISDARARGGPPPSPGMAWRCQSDPSWQYCPEPFSIARSTEGITADSIPPVIFDLQPVRQQYACRGIRDLPDRDLHAIAGFALLEVVRLPEVGEAFRYDGWRFEIADMRSTGR